MDISRLKSLRAGNRAAVTKVFNKLEDAIVDTPLDPEEICTLLEAVEKKKKTLANIDEQILNTVDSEGITDEIIETDEYYLELESKIRKYKKFLKPVATATSSILDSNAQEFIPHSNPFTHSSREPSQTSSTSSQNHRLPKLTLPNFSGDILEWQYFWDSFESTIHHNSTLSDIQKFSYLKSLLQSDAANVVSGLTMTNPNYYKAIELLKNRYGQTHKIINAYMRSLLDMPVPDERLESLRAFYDKSEAYIRGLESLGQCQEMFGSLLIPVILGKLPPDFRKNITRENGSDDWNIQKLRDAICRELSIQESGHNEYMYQPPTANHTANFVASVKKDFSKNRPQGKTSKYQGMKKPINSAQRKACIFCEGDHFSNDCTDVAEHEKRIAIIKEKKLCFNCFGTHRVSDCRSKYDCRICHRKHHTSICKKNTTHQSEDKDNTETSMLYTSASQETSTVLLKTAVAQVMSVNNTAEANILFDEGAQRSFITADLATKLNVQKEGSENLNVVSFGNKTSGIRNLDKTTVQLKANNGEIIPIKVLIVPSIASPLQSQSRKITQGLHYLHGLSLAHPVTDAESFELTLLIGADFYWSRNIVQDKVIRENGPTAVSSKLGYLLSGPVPVKNNNQSTSMMNVLISHKQETCDLEKFWKLESLGIDEKEVDTQLIDVMETFAESSITKQNGKYVSKLLWKEHCPELPTNKEIVKRRTENVIRRISKDKEMFRMYGDIISDQERRGFIEEVSDETLTENLIHYIPHHAVKKDSTTTPIRIVYNCSCKANSYSASLNDCLAEYPPMMNDLTTILTRFRMEKYAVTVDIEKAFLHIELDENDRDVTRFFWLQNPNNPNSPLITYRFKVVLFGATCSPFILSATLMKHFKENPSNTSSELQRNIYVDNILTSFPDETTLLKFYTESRTLLHDAGFNLRSWNSNNENLRNRAIQEKAGDENQTVKILGMRWNTKSDNILYNQLTLTENDDIPLTKREVLRQSSRIFDPLGLISPVTVTSKLFMQRLWKEKLNWDELLPRSLKEEWKSIAMEIEEATKTEISRQITPESDAQEETELHIFTDASQQAYGACAYLVKGNTSSLIITKNRVAPVKTITLPRLELMGALIGARLANCLVGFIDITKKYFWSDSQIVLSWISSTKTLPTFVSNRLKEIRKLAANSDWRYCPTDQNPADYLTRGITAKQLMNSALWIKGPKWIANKTEWPTWTRNVENCNTFSTITEEYMDAEIHVPKTSCIQIEKYSSLSKLVRITAYVLRFIRNLKTRKSERTIGILSIQEIGEAEITLIRNVQRTTFELEIDCLNPSSKHKVAIVRQLRLYLDDNGLLRGGGRLNNAPLEYNTKYPILLPTKHHFTSLIIRDMHHKNLHSGLNSTIAHIQQKFWIPRIRQCVKYHLRKCSQCNKVTGEPYRAPEPPPLPKDRLNDEYPFFVTGVDFTGALCTKGQNNIDFKTYICLFTCAATRAVHLEIVPDMKEESFMLAFKRFVARRSLPRIMMSDNANTFKAAAQSIQQKVVERGTEWKFIPNRAPWFGGWWERLIGLTKNAIKKVLGRSFVTIDMLRTIVTEIESMLNNRPITYISTDITHPQPLTPSHLLNGRRLDSLPHQMDDIENFHNSNHSSCNKKLQRQHQLIEHFRTRWRNEYLTSLREFHRATGNNVQTIEVGDIVQVHNDSNRLMWRLAVVKELIRGKDGFIRTAIIKTDTGITNRPIVKLYPLELQGPTSENCKTHYLLRSRQK